jgi:HEPN domain-containing protein
LAKTKFGLSEASRLFLGGPSFVPHSGRAVATRHPRTKAPAGSNNGSIPAAADAQTGVGYIIYLWCMGKPEIIRHWIQMADRDWQSVQLLFQGRQFIHALFFCHWVIEKMIKAHWVYDNEETTPPRTHDLESLYAQTDLECTAPQLDLLRVINAWNLEGRYQDYKDKFFKSATLEYTESKIKEVDSLRQWLLSELQKKK